MVSIGRIVAAMDAIGARLKLQDDVEAHQLARGSEIEEWYRSYRRIIEAPGVLREQLKRAVLLTNMRQARLPVLLDSIRKPDFPIQCHDPVR